MRRSGTVRVNELPVAYTELIEFVNVLVADSEALRNVPWDVGESHSR